MSIQKDILLVDESGKPDFKDPTFRHFLLAGVMIPESELRIVSGYFSYIKRKHKLRLDEPFHTYDLLENPTTKMPTQQARQFVTSMTDFISTCPINVFLIHTDKVRFQEKFRSELTKTMKIRPNNTGIIYFLSTYKLFQLFIDLLHSKKTSGYVYA